MYGQIKLSTCSCVRTDLISIFFTKQLDTCTVYNVHVVALVITHSRTCTMYHQKFCLTETQFLHFFLYNQS